MQELLNRQLIGMEAVLGAAIINDPRVQIAFKEAKRAVENFENTVVNVSYEVKTKERLWGPG